MKEYFSFNINIHWEMLPAKSVICCLGLNVLDIYKFDIFRDILAANINYYYLHTTGLTYYSYIF